jgi:hypothetical protein
MKKKNFLGTVCRVNGKGLWSNVVANVKLESVELSPYGELRIYFDCSTWKVSNDGIIYTDPQFLTDFRETLVSKGFTKTETMGVDYSEAGMQGDDYVSMDVNMAFVNGWKRTTTA